MATSPRKSCDRRYSPRECLHRFWRSVSGLCAYLAGNFGASAESFLQAGEEYAKLGFLGNSDLCFFHAIEAGKRTSDLDRALDIARRVIDGFSFEENAAAGTYKQQLVNIIASYYTHSGDYVGPTVQCRRVIELYLSRLLETKVGTPIRQQLKQAKAAGEIPKNARDRLLRCNSTGGKERYYH